MIRRKSLPAIKVTTLEKKQHQDPALGIENYIFRSNFNPAVDNSFEEIAKRSKQLTEKGLAYSSKIFF